jgi:gliding motility-associated-like protein
MKRIFVCCLLISTISFAQEYVNFYPWTNGGLSATDWRSDPDPAQSGPKTGCVYSDVSIALSGGAWQTSNPQWAYNTGGMTAADGFGLRLGVNWTSVNQTVTLTITFKDAPGGNITEYPVDFSVFDINAHACGASESNRFIDVVSIVGYKANLTTAVNPNSIVPSCPQNIVTGNSVKGSGFCGLTRTAVTFNSTNTVARIVITYSSGTGDPASQNCAGSPPQLLSGHDPRAQEIWITPFRLTGPSSTAPSGITGTTSICNGSSTTLTATGGNSSSRWYTGSCGGTQVGTGSSITISPSSTTTYYVANQGLCGITTCASATVTVTAPPNAGTNGTANFCSNGASANLFSSLGGTPSTTGTWSGPSALGGGHLGTYDPVTMNPGIYTYMVVGSGGCPNATATVSVSEISSPTAPVVGVITQPTCTVPTGSVALSGLPSSGSWTVTAAPGGATITGSGTTANFGGLAPNQTYTFTVTNSGNCTSPSSGNAPVNPIPPNPSAPAVGVITQPTCLAPTGSVALSGLPAGNWTITASPGGSTQSASGASTTFTGLTPGVTYNFTVTDQNGCTSANSANAPINALPASPSAPAIADIIQPTCTEATATVELSGLPAGNWDLTITPGGAVVNGSGATYAWIGLGNNNTYTFIVTDDNGCSSVSSLDATVIAQPQTPAVPVIENVIQPTCAVATGSVEFSNLPATGDWTLTTDPSGLTFTSNGTTGTFAGLPANSSFTFTVTNADGCTSTSTGSAVFNVQPITPDAPIVGAITQPTCSAPTGSVELSGLPAGNWTLTSTPGGSTQDNSGATATFTGLAPNDTYTFMVTNDEGCTSVASLPADIDPIPGAPSAPAIADIIQPTCTEATATVELSGLPAGDWDLTITPGGAVVNGSGATYSWPSLGAGNTYTFVVTDANGCSSISSANAVVNPQPQTPAVPVIENIIQPTCAVATGSVEFSNLPATGDWTLTTDPSGLTFTSNGTTGTFAGLPANSSFTFTVTNADGCTSSATGSAVINAQPITPDAPIVGAITQPTCSAPTGSVELSGLPAGNWTLTSTPGGLTQNNSGATATFTGLMPNANYTITVTNDQGCESLASAQIAIDPIPGAPSAPAIADIIQPTCTEATATVELSGLPAGDWDLTITPGGAVVNGSGATYAWTGLGNNNTYTFIVTDDNGCSSVSSLDATVIAQPQTPAVPVIENIIQPTCTVSTGSVAFSNLPAAGDWTLTTDPSGLTFTSNGTTGTFAGLPANSSFTFTVTNADGCTSTSTGSAVINAQPITPDAPIVGAITQPTCSAPTGSVELSGLPAGNWTLTSTPGGLTQNNSGATTTFTDLAPNANYTITVTNDQGCESAASAQIAIDPIPGAPSAPAIADIIQPTCTEATATVELSGLPAGDWDLTITPGGTVVNGSGATYAWTGLGNNNTYTFIVTDDNGCSSVSSANAVVNPQPQTPAVPVIENIIQPTCTVATGSVEFSNLPATGDWTLTTDPSGLTFTSNGTTGAFAGLPASSSFTFTVTNADGCTSTSTGSAVINAQPITPDAPIVGAITQPTCSAPTGSVELSGLPAGNWTLTSTPGGLTQNNSGATTTFTDLAPNANYTITVTNDQGCESAASAQIAIDPIPGAPSAPAIADIIQPTCTEATATVELSGLPAGNWDLTITPGGAVVNGSGATYAWTGLGNNNTYTFIVTDDNGCSSVSSLDATVIAQPQTPAVPVIENIIQPTCAVATGSVEFSNLPAAGDWTLTTDPSGLTFTSNGTTGAFAGLPASSSFTFTVTNADGCTSTSTGSAAINAQPITPDAPIVGAITQPTCSAPTGSVELSGLPAGNWTLTSTPGGLTQNNSGATTTFTDLAPNANYTITVTNDQGCESAASAQIAIDPIPGAPSAPAIADIIQPTCTEATATVELSGLPAGDWDLTITPGGAVVNGSGATYAWTGLGNNNTYTFIVTDDNGCSSVSSLDATVIAQPQTPAVPVIENVIQPTCAVATGSVEFSNLPAAGDWTLTTDPSGLTFTSNGTTGAFAGLPASSSFTFTVTNADGCTSTSTGSAAINAQPITPDAPIVGAITQPTCSAPTGSVELSGLPVGNWTLTSTPGGLTQNNSGATTTFTDLAPNANYTITVTNDQGCESAASAQIAIDPIPGAPSAPAIADIIQPTCTEATATVELSGLPAGDWDLTITPGGTVVNGSGATYAWTGLGNNNTYTFIVTDDNGCSSVSSANAVVNPQPQTPAVPVIENIIQPTCTVSTGSVAFSNLPAAGDWTLTTDPSGLTFTSNGTTGTFAGLPANSSFTFTVTNADGCTSTSTGSAVINAQPITPDAPIVGAITQPTCSAPTGSVELSGLPAGNWTLTSTPGGSTQDNSGATATFTGLMPNTNYTITVTNDQGCESLASAQIAIDPIPGAPSAPAIADIIQPTCTEATATVELSGLPAGDWDLTITPGGVVVNGSGATYAWTGLGNNNTYTFIVTDDNGCSSISSANAVVNPQPQTPAVPVIENIIQPTCAVATGSVEFSNLPATGDWTLTTDPSGLTFTSNGTTGTFAGLPANSSFTFTVTNADGCTSTSTGSAVINVQPITPDAPIVGAITQPTCSAPTGSVELSGLPAGNWTLTSTPGGSTQDNSGATATFTGLMPNTNYTITVTNDQGCESLASAQIAIDPIPGAPSAPAIADIIQPTCTEATATVELSGLPAGDWDLTITPGGAVVNGSGATYAWTGLGDDETYTFIVTDDNGCPSLSSADAIVDPQPQTPAVPVIENVIQPTCTVATGSVEFSNLPASGNWTLTILPDNTDITNAGDTYVLDGLAENSTYTFVVTNDEGCTSTATMEVSFNAQPQTPDAPIVDGQIDPTCLVPTGSVEMSGLPSGTWELTALPSGVTMSGSTTTATFSGLQPGQSYTFTVTNADGCTSAESVEITVADIPNNPVAPDVTVTTQPTCTDPVGSIEVTDLSGGTVQYSVNGVDFQGSGIFTGLAPGIYNVVVQDAQTGCISASTQITIDPVPTVPAAPLVASGDVTYCLGDEIQPLVASGSTDNYVWFADAQLTNELGVGASYQPTGQLGVSTYYVVAVSGDCQSAATLVTVSVNDCTPDDIVIPGGFTPNNDGVNDYWQIIGLDEQYPNNIVYIYNRWGNLLFESEQGSYSTSMWDGTYKGDPLPVGSYYYLIMLDGSSSGDVLKGTVSIIKN